jgi:hypothetical protein
VRLRVCDRVRACALGCVLWMFDVCGNRQDIVGTSTWPLPPTVTPINGLVLSVNWTPYGFYDWVRVLLQAAQNCVYDYDIPTLKPWAYTLLHRHCYNASLPLWTKIVPDNINNMDQVKYIYLVSLDYVAALSFNTTLPTTIVKVCATPGAVPCHVLVSCRVVSCYVWGSVWCVVR